MSRPNSTNSLYATKALSFRSSTLSGRSSPSSLNGAGGVATFISSRNHRPTPFQRNNASRQADLRDHGSSEEPEEGGGVGVKYEPQNQQQEQYEDAASSPPEKQEDEDEDYEEDEDSMSVASRASTPRQVRFPQGSNTNSLKGQNAPGQVLRIPDFQQIFNNEEYDVFEDEDTPSFSETTVTVPKVLDNMRLPLPGSGQSVTDSPAPWGKMNREQSEDSEIIEIKQEAFHARQDSGGGAPTGGKTGFEKVTNTEMRLEVAAWQEGDDEEERDGRRGGSELSNGYESKRGEIDYGEEPIQHEEDETEYYNEYSDGNEGSDYDERKDGPGIWSEGSPTISSRGWLGHRSKESLENIPPYSNSKGKGKTKEQYLDDPQRLDMHPPKPNMLPLTVRSRPGDTVMREDSELSPRERAEMTIQAAGHGGHGASNKELAVVPERKKKKKEQSRRIITTSSKDIDLSVLLSDSELASIPTYADLLTHLATLRSNTHTTIPSTQLPSELDELAKSYYPHDPRKPEKFFNKLDDKQHALAGEYILSKKRELEEQLAGVVAKRRRVCERMKEEVERVAEVRVVKLKRTEERREMLKGGVGRMLKEAGLWL